MRTFFIVLTLFLLSCNDTEVTFDTNEQQKPVLTHAGIDSVLNLFPTVAYSELNNDYVSYSHSDGKFKSSLQNEVYYVLKGDDVLRYIVGEYRIRDFISTDIYYTKNRADYSKKVVQYWLVDKTMLYMMLDLILELEALDHDKYGFTVRESHRHPKFNAARGGASKSQHVWGRAVDIVIADINQDGTSNQADKSIVLEIMERIVGDKGGLGRYPNTLTVHFDSRGYRARWDKQ